MTEKASSTLEDEVLVDTHVASTILKMAPNTLVAWRKQGRGPAFYRFGKAVRYAVRDLNEWADQRRCGTNA